MRYDNNMKTFDPNVLLKKMQDRSMTTVDLLREIYRRSDTLRPSGQIIQQWLNGIGAPSAKYLPTLADTFKCKIDDFFTEQGK